MCRFFVVMENHCYKTGNEIIKVYGNDAASIQTVHSWLTRKFIQGDFDLEEEERTGFHQPWL